MYENLGEDLWDQSEQSVRPLQAPCRKPCSANATCMITYACPCDERLTVVVHLHGRLSTCLVILRASLEQALIGYQHTVGLATESFSMVHNKSKDTAVLLAHPGVVSHTLDYISATRRFPLRTPCTIQQAIDTNTPPAPNP